MTEQIHTPYFLKGLLAGAIAGIAATAVKTIAEKFYPPRVQGEPEPPELFAEKLAGHALDRQTKTVGGEAIHWGFGAAVGAAYGALVEFYPAASADEGAAFGLSLMALTHETALPSMGLSAPASEQSPREQSSEASSDALFGMMLERVRRVVRGYLN